VSKIQPLSEGNVPADVPQPTGPFKNPSYPQRVHIQERAYWQGVLRSCEERIAVARKKLDVLGNSPTHAAFERLYAQMLGARDQVADAAQRLPGETGALYKEDRERLEQAVAALVRVFREWDAQKV
jgi:hypothetical protein